MRFVSRQDTATLAVLLALVSGCATGGSGQAFRNALADQANTLAAELAAAPAPEPGSLRVRLAFAAAADLDLYVTGPSTETVYYANTPTRAGGRLAEDLRCQHPAPRVETVTFAVAPRGRYRVGVDFPERCDGGRDPVAYVVELRSGEQRVERRRSIRPAEFQVIVMEVDVE